MRWHQTCLYKTPPSQTRVIGTLRCQDALGKRTVGAWVLASGIQIICNLLADLWLLEMQGEIIIMTLPKIYRPYPPQMPSMKSQ